ncbi:hypothetical protein SBDP1_1190005 [Syntrophobacter sp. SbD1]|nr:hypothetical protein SBDP1_1190005 [Syntrophobacter sp. SbD1]
MELGITNGKLHLTSYGAWGSPATKARVKEQNDSMIAAGGKHGTADKKWGSVMLEGKISGVIESYIVREYLN